VAQDMDLGVTPFDQLAIHPDLAVAIGHRHGSTSSCGARGLRVVNR
jgi:hypothetical protein